MNYLFFDKRVHVAYRKATKNTMTQPPDVVSIYRQYHGLHISFLTINQLKSHARELDVRINSVDATQQAHPRTRMVALEHNHTRTPNLINDAILKLSRYDFHLRDADKLLIIIIMQHFLHTQPSVYLLGIPPSSYIYHSGSQFTLLGNPHAYIPCTHRQELHN